jgi:hypothetical protein
MDRKMTLLAVRATGHVVAALTRVAAPEAELTVDQLAGDGVPLRSPAAMVLVPAGELALATLPFAATVFASPRDARVLFPPATQPDAEPTLGTVDGSEHGQLATVTGATLEVDLSSGTVAEDSPFTVVFQGGGGEPTVVVNGQIDEGQSTSAAMSHSLQPGTGYTALVLLAGYAPHFDTVP